MKIGDYIHSSVLEEIGPKMYEDYRNALRFIGHNVSKDVGNWFTDFSLNNTVSIFGKERFGVTLTECGNLMATDIRNFKSNSVSKEEIERLINLTLVA